MAAYHRLCTATDRTAEFVRYKQGQFFTLSYHPIPWRDSISRPIAPVSSIPLDHAARAQSSVFKLDRNFALTLGTCGMH
jgi:hypothetical protein